jgi:hypothetical protein
LTQSPHTRQLTPPSWSANPQFSDMNVGAYEDFPLPAQVGVDITRTNSPENIAMMYNGSFSSMERNVPNINSHVPAHGIIRNRPHQSDVDMRLTGLELSTARFSSQQQFNGTPSMAKRSVPKKRLSRMLTQQGKEDAYKVRSTGGACELCRLTKKVVSGNLTPIENDLCAN